MLFQVQWITALLLILFYNSLIIVSAGNYTATTHKLFNQFIEKYNKPYRNGTKLYEERYQIFLENFKRLTEFTVFATETQSAQFGITKFADLSPTEFKEKYLTKMKPYKAPRFQTTGRKEKPLPTTFDWREHEIITPVKDQGKCGACWAFTFTELVESMVAKSGGRLTELSTQEVLDCTSKNYSCAEGGNHCVAANTFMGSGKPLVPAELYPYKEKHGQCNIPQSEDFNAVVKNYTCISYLNQEDNLARAVVNLGPAAIAVDATMWQFYMGGIIQHHCEKSLNHAAVIVGFDFTGPVPYYIVRNSWGSNWGNAGYLYLAYGKDICGLTTIVLQLEAVENKG